MFEHPGQKKCPPTRPQRPKRKEGSRGHNNLYKDRSVQANLHAISRIGYRTIATIDAAIKYCPPTGAYLLDVANGDWSKPISTSPISNLTQFHEDKLGLPQHLT